jgi:AAA domain
MPQDIKILKRWINWHLTPDGDKLKKTPMVPGTASYASVDKPETWRSYEDAKSDGRALGFVLGKEVGLCIVDFDRVRESRQHEWPEWVLEEVAQLDSYTEVSASGKGLHVLVWGSVPSNMNRQGCNTEVWDSNKMFCLTFDVLQGRDVIRSRDMSTLHKRIEEGRIGPEYVPQLHAESYNKEKYVDVVNGNYAKHGLGRSEAVQSALWTLARKTDFDPDKMREEFEKTELCAEWGSKWQRLGESEIKRAIAEVQRREEVVAKPKTTAYNISFQKDQVAGEDDQYVLCPKYEFDGWFPLGAVSIIAGSSGAGKSTLMLDLLHKQASGADYLGHKTCSWPFLIVATDRGMRSNRRTLRRLKLDKANINIDHLPAAWGEAAVKLILTYIERAAVLPRVVFIEGADMLVEDANKINVVYPFITALQKISDRYHLAIVLSVGSPKSSPKTGSPLARDRVFGSQAWPRLTDSIITVSVPGDGTGNEREIIVQHRDAATEKFQMEFSEGKLVERKTADPTETITLNVWASKTQNFTKSDARKAFPKMNGSTLDKALAGLVRGGAIRRGDDDVYRYNAVDFQDTEKGVSQWK